ncbi:MAG: hypothetical protein NTY23_12775, partial [Chloroflexi bacterium]|nr:hypothetical protein [Chloroflexota bacterium]
ATSSAASAGAFENTEAANSANTLTTWTAGTGWALEAGSTAADPKAGQFTGDVEISGDLNVDGVASGFFPRPAYDSGWFALPNSGTRPTLWHNLGDSVDNYVVDFQCKAGGLGINNVMIGYQEQYDLTEWHGAYYYGLTTAYINTYREPNDNMCPQARVRIWVYE